MQDLAARRQSPSASGRKPRVWGVLTMFAVLGVIVGCAVVFGLLPRLQQQKNFLAEAATDGERIPAVNVTPVKRAPAKGELELPGTLQALNEAPIYARVDGYIKRRYVDIGERVKSGQLMAELDTPELDQQIRQSEASIAQTKAALLQLEAAIRQAQANLKLASVTAGRVRQLTAEGVLSKQELDDKEAAFEARQADVAASEANLAAGKNAVTANEANTQRLKELKAFSRITAPFDGVITYRNPDVGTLITSGNNGANREMFRVAQIDPMRIFVSVPQTYVAEAESATGSKAELIIDQLPGRKFIADVRRSNAALDANSRTMLTILYVANPKAELLPGMFARVKFSVGDTVRRLIVPGDAVVSRPDGPHVAVVDSSNTVQFRKIVPGRDSGSTMEVNDGVSEGELVIANPTDDVRDGAKVQVRQVRK
jgi:RND family efflux transporter MFP subunit